MVRVQGGELEPFYIDEGLVSQATDEPAVSVTWVQAQAHCASHGKRLPTDAEWHHATGIRDRVGTVFQWTRTLYHPPPDATFAPELQGTRRVVRGSCCPWLPTWSEPGYRTAYPEDRHSTWLGFRCARPLDEALDGNLAADEDSRLEPEAIDESEAVRQLLSNLYGPGRLPAAAPVQQLMDELEPGAVVADVGCGLGALSLQLARRVGPTGRVFAVDVDPQVLEFVGGVARAEGIGNLVPHRSRSDQLGLSAGSTDLVLLYDMVRGIRDEEQAGFAVSCASALAPAGRLVLYQTLGSDPPSSLLERLSDAGLVLERTVTQAPIPGPRPMEERVVLWVYRKPDSE